MRQKDADTNDERNDHEKCIPCQREQSNRGEACECAYKEDHNEDHGEPSNARNLRKRRKQQFELPWFAYELVPSRFKLAQVVTRSIDAV